MTTSTDGTNDRLREAHPTDSSKFPHQAARARGLSSPSMCEDSRSIPEKLSE